MVADVFYALVQPDLAMHPGYEECVRMIQEERGKHFDPKVVDAFLQMEAIQIRFCNESGGEEYSTYMGDILYP